MVDHQFYWCHCSNRLPLSLSLTSPLKNAHAHTHSTPCTYIWYCSAHTHKTHHTRPHILIKRHHTYAYTTLPGKMSLSGDKKAFAVTTYCLWHSSESVWHSTYTHTKYHRMHIHMAYHTPPTDTTYYTIHIIPPHTRILYRTMPIHIAYHTAHIHISYHTVHMLCHTVHINRSCYSRHTRITYYVMHVPINSISNGEFRKDKWSFLPSTETKHRYNSLSCKILTVKLAPIIEQCHGERWGFERQWQVVEGRLFPWLIVGVLMHRDDSGRAVSETVNCCCKCFLVSRETFSLEEMCIGQASTHGLRALSFCFIT